MRYAGFWRRLIAISIDQFLLGLAAYFVASAVTVTILYASAVSKAQSDRISVYAAVAAYLALSLIYYSLLEGKTGETIGKRLMKLKLVRMDQPNRDGIGVARGALRLAVAAVLQVFAGVNYVLMLLDKQRLALHDKLFKTAVVYDPAGKFAAFDPDKFPETPRRIAVFVIAIFLSVLTTIGQIMFVFIIG
jgi:uncharacterized RDD family membrane protein YckC